MKIKFFITLLLCSIGITQAQTDFFDETDYSIKSITSVSTGKKHLPYWLVSGMNGQVAHYPLNNSILFGIGKNYFPENHFSIAYKLEILTSISEKSRIAFNNAYIEPKFMKLSVLAGYKNLIMGNQSELSSGGLVFSGNSPSMPLAELAFNEYASVPFTHNILHIKGNVGNALLNDHKDFSNINVHFKSFFAKLGGDFALNFEYGLIHAAQWGGKSSVYGQLPNSIGDFYSVFTASSGSENSPEGERINKLGNHIFSQNYGIYYKMGTVFSLKVYYQNINEDNPVYLLPVRYIKYSPNKRDMLLGIELKTDLFKPIHTILYEYLNTKDQSGPYHDKDGMIYGGTDNYYNNYVYTYGWSYKDYTIGTPVISSFFFNENGAKSFINNRVTAHHFAIKGTLSKYNYLAHYLHSRNLGLYYGPMNRYNHSISLELNSNLCERLNIGGSLKLSADYGEMYGNNFGLQITLLKKGLF